MTFHDTINAIFEGGGALFLCLNVRRLLKDKSVKGVSLLTTSWWTAWGFWNVYFYAAVSYAASFWAGLAVVLVNAVWLGLAVHYASEPRRPTAVEPAPSLATCKACGHALFLHNPPSAECKWPCSFGSGAHYCDCEGAVP